MTDKMKSLILSLGNDFVKLDFSLGRYCAAGIFKVGKTKKSLMQEVKYFEDECPLEAVNKLYIELVKYKNDNKKLYE